MVTDRRLFIVRIVQISLLPALSLGQPRSSQNIIQLDLHKLHDSVFISFRKKMVRNKFWTDSEYKIMRNFIVEISTWDWLISKFASFLSG